MVKIIRNEELDEKALAALSADEREWVYNALDVTVTFEVHDRQLEGADDIALATAEFSRQLSVPILEMNMRGTLIDAVERRQVLAEFKAMHKRIEAQLLRILFEGVGISPPFNYRSHPSVLWLLHSVLGLKPVMKRNSNGVFAPTDNREALEKLSKYYTASPIITHILALRDLDKRIQFLETEIDRDGRLRTTFNVAGTNTGRLSSSASDEGTGGNQQNIERRLRQVYVPDPGWKFCNIDLEQGDSRNVGAICWQSFYVSHGAEFAGAYLDACESGDLHTTVAKMTWRDLPWTGDAKADRAIADQVFYREFSRRDMTKRLGHGTNYVGQPATMASHTKIDRSLVTEFQSRYFAAFPCIPAWHEWVKGQLLEKGCLITPFYRRRRYFFGRPDDASTIREAVAYSPQSMTADAIDTALINLWRWRDSQKRPVVQLLIQVHDSILMQYREEAEEEVIPEILRLASIKHTMIGGREFCVPPEAKTGWNWRDFDAKENPGGLLKWKSKPDLRPRPAHLLLPTTFAGRLDAPA